MQPVVRGGAVRERIEDRDRTRWSRPTRSRRRASTRRTVRRESSVSRAGRGLGRGPGWAMRRARAEHRREPLRARPRRLVRSREHMQLRIGIRYCVDGLRIRDRVDENHLVRSRSLSAHARRPRERLAASRRRRDRRRFCRSRPAPRSRASGRRVLARRPTARRSTRCRRCGRRPRTIACHDDPAQQPALRDPHRRIRRRRRDAGPHRDEHARPRQSRSALGRHRAGLGVEAARATTMEQCAT